MFWLYLYAASVIPAMLMAGYALGRAGMGKAPQMAVLIGCAWLVVLPVLGLVLLVERAVKMGEASNL